MIDVQMTKEWWASLYPSECTNEEIKAILRFVQKVPAINDKYNIDLRISCRTLVVLLGDIRFDILTTHIGFASPSTSSSDWFKSVLSKYPCQNGHYLFMLPSVVQWFLNDYLYWGEEEVYNPDSLEKDPVDYIHSYLQGDHDNVLGNELTIERAPLPFLFFYTECNEETNSIIFQAFLTADCEISLSGEGGILPPYCFSSSRESNTNLGVPKNVSDLCPDVSSVNDLTIPQLEKIAHAALIVLLRNLVDTRHSSDEKTLSLLTAIALDYYGEDVSDEVKKELIELSV